MNLKEQVEAYVNEKGLISLTHMKNRNEKLQNEIKENTEFTQFSKYKITFKDRVLYILQGLTNLKKC